MTPPASAPPVERLYAVLMAGGSGTRFWPASREAQPKQLLSIAGGRSLLADTYQRVLPLVGPDRVLVVTSLGLAARVARELPQLDPDRILVEPCGRNTAPCALLAAQWVHARDPGARLALFPADHLVSDAAAFRAAISGAMEYLDVSGGGAVLTFGLRPSRPETGFGYIEVGAPVDGAPLPLHRALRFVEKPDAARAREFVDSGRFAWNSGIFACTAARLLELFARHLPEVHARLQEVFALPADRREEALARVYPALPSVSIDTGVMEKAQGLLVAPVAVGWSDVGCWGALLEALPSDTSRNVILGDALVLDGERTVVYSPDRLTVVFGLSDVVVVQTPDAVLVCPRERSQDVRRVVAALRERGRGDLL